MGTSVGGGGGGGGSVGSGVSVGRGVAVGVGVGKQPTAAMEINTSRTSKRIFFIVIPP